MLSSILPEPVTLLPPRLKTWLSAYWLWYGVCLGPLIFTSLSLHYFLGLNLVQLATAMAVISILLLNVYFYVLRKRKEEDGISIWIDLEEIQLLRKGIVLYKDSLKNLRVTKMDLPVNPKNVPNTLLIEGKHFPRLYIRSAQTIKILRSMEKTDFCVDSDKEWKRLVNALAGAQEAT